jgi:hypothetical protein
MLQHARTDFDSKQPRTLRRTPVLEKPGANRFPHSCEFRRNPAGDSDLMSAAVPI